MAKILYTRKPLAYVDCFAGKGKFDGGNPGSPLIALDIFRQGLAATRLDGNARIGAAFIDLNYATDLEKNLSDYKGIKIVSGAYEDIIEDLLKTKTGYNVFLWFKTTKLCTLYQTEASCYYKIVKMVVKFGENERGKEKFRIQIHMLIR